MSNPDSILNKKILLYVFAPIVGCAVWMIKKDPDPLIPPPVDITIHAKLEAGMESESIQVQFYREGGGIVSDRKLTNGRLELSKTSPIGKLIITLPGSGNVRYSITSNCKIRSNQKEYQGMCRPKNEEENDSLYPGDPLVIKGNTHLYYKRYKPNQPLFYRNQNDIMFSYDSRLNPSDGTSVDWVQLPPETNQESQRSNEQNKREIPVVAKKENDVIDNTQEKQPEIGKLTLEVYCLDNDWNIWSDNLQLFVDGDLQDVRYGSREAKLQFDLSAGKHEIEFRKNSVSIFRETIDVAFRSKGGTYRKIALKQKVGLVLLSKRPVVPGVEAAVWIDGNKIIKWPVGARSIETQIEVGTRIVEVRTTKPVDRVVFSTEVQAILGAKIEVKVD